MKLIHPFSCIVAGPSGSGKSVFTVKLIEQASEIIEPPPEHVQWCYGVFQNFFHEIRGVEFQQGLPLVQTFDGKRRTLLVIDDLMQEADKTVSSIFTRDSHHRNISVIFLSQNLFYDSKENRTMTLNSNYLVLFKNPRDQTVVRSLSMQMYPGRSKFLVDAYKDATSKPFSYLLIDLRPDTEDRLRIRSNIFPDETTFVYVPK